MGQCAPLRRSACGSAQHIRRYMCGTAQPQCSAARRWWHGTALLCSALHCRQRTARTQRPPGDSRRSKRESRPRPQRMRLLTTAYTAWTHCVRTLVLVTLGGTLASLAARQDVPHSSCTTAVALRVTTEDSEVAGAMTRWHSWVLGYSGTHRRSGTHGYSGTHCR